MLSWKEFFTGFVAPIGVIGGIVVFLAFVCLIFWISKKVEDCWVASRQWREQPRFQPVTNTWRVIGHYLVKPFVHLPLAYVILAGGALLLGNALERVIGYSLGGAVCGLIIGLCILWYARKHPDPDLPPFGVLLVYLVSYFALIALFLADLFTTKNIA